MPPANASRPSRTVIDTFAAGLEAQLDRAAEASPNPGTTVLHRLNRTEYANAIRELLALNVDVTTLLPADDSSDGFDNIADVLRGSPTLIQRYLSAAMKISRIAIGDLETLPSRFTYRGNGQGEGLPAGTRGERWFVTIFPSTRSTRSRSQRGEALEAAGAPLYRVHPTLS